jgi:CDP-glycerol glycerophosphotransferase (TagB/SpsB family)
MPGKSKMTILLGIRYLLWYLLSIPAAIFATVRGDRVILASNRGEGLTGNARHLFETWQKDGSFDVWAVVSNKEIYKELSGQYPHILLAFSWDALKVSTQSRFFILTHGRLDVPFCGLRKTIIQTWHGIPFKAIGFYRNNKASEKIRNLLYKWFDYDSVDYFLSSSAFVTKLLMQVFRQKPEKFLEIGFPRNDVFLLEIKKSEHILTKVLKERPPSFKKVILYTPTYRPYRSVYFPFADRSEKSDAFIELLQSTDSVCLVKSHSNQQLVLDSSLGESGRIIDISNYTGLPDLQEILLKTDILITDYSSVSIDSLLMDMQCVYITSDIEEYIHATGEFCCDYNSLAAGVHVRSMADMIYELNELIQSRDRFEEERRSARELFFPFTTDTSTNRLASFMKQV